MSQPDIRGHSRFDYPATLSIRLMAWATDACLGLVLVLLTYSVFGAVFGLDPLLDWKLLLISVVALVAPFFAGRYCLGQSFGEKIWKIERGKTRVRESSDDTIASLLTFIFVMMAIGLFEIKIAAHPYWSTPENQGNGAGNELKIQAVLPPSDWRVLAFYYSLAPWPASVGGHPVFYSLPYEIGPPKRFVGHIEADWVRESVRLTFEGPKTPIEFQAREKNRQDLKDCFLTSPLLHPSCVEVRRQTLERPLQEDRARGYTKFNVTWFSSDNPAFSDGERAQGVRLRSRAPGRTQDRYILVTPDGIHQSIALSYLENDEGKNAEHDFKIALGALRISEDLGPGRAWTDRLLQSVNLNAEKDAIHLDLLSSVESLLVSKISVSPDSFQAYYHLAGSSFLLLKYCLKNDGPDCSELKSQAQAMVERMSRYGHDVDPKNPDLPALEKLSQETKRF